MAREKTMPKVDYDTCIACGVCIIACPTSCIECEYIPPTDEYKKPRPQIIYPEYCTSCGLCAKACTIEVIEMVPAEGLIETLEKEHDERKILAVEQEEQRKIAAEEFLKAMMAQAEAAEAEVEAGVEAEAEAAEA